MAANQPDVSVVIVSYNTSALIGDCLRSLLAESRNLVLETTVVDNASHDGSCDMVRRDFPGVRLIANERNLGYARANNMGLASSAGRYLLLLNPDTVVVDGAIERMVAFMDGHPAVGACGCRLIYPDGSYQRSAQPLPDLFSPLYEYLSLLDRFPLLCRLLAPGWTDRPEDTRPVGYCSGACLLVSRGCLERVGILDENFFLYGEDADWCRRMWNAGWPVYYLPSARVIHLEGRSSRCSSPLRRLREVRGELQFLRKWHGRHYVWAYQSLARACSLLRLARIVWRLYRGPDPDGLLSDNAAFYRAMVAGRSPALPDPSEAG